MEKLMAKALERARTGDTYRGMPYEQGIVDAINFLTDPDEESPLSEVGG